MKVAIVGSRDYPDRQAVSDYVASLPPDAIVVSGGARGVDRWAEEAARERGLRVEVYPADWNLHGRAAGFIRNQQIVDAADRVAAFWNGRSRGTQDTIRRARKAGKPVEVIMHPVEASGMEIPIVMMVSGPDELAWREHEATILRLNPHASVVHISRDSDRPAQFRRAVESFRRMPDPLDSRTTGKVPLRLLLVVGFPIDIHDVEAVSRMRADGLVGEANGLKTVVAGFVPYPGAGWGWFAPVAERLRLKPIERLSVANGRGLSFACSGPMGHEAD